MNHLTVGRILKARREELNFTQRQVADKLNYQNPNFVSMFENGTSNVPIKAIPDIVKVYGLPPEFGGIILRASDEDIWNAAVGILEPLAGKLSSGSKTLNKDIDKEAAKLKRKYGL